MPEITRRELVAALMASLYRLTTVTSVTPITDNTRLLLITISDGIEFGAPSLKEMTEDLDDILAKAGLPNLRVLALYGGRVYSLCGPVVPEMNVLPNP